MLLVLLICISLPFRSSKNMCSRVRKIHIQYINELKVGYTFIGVYLKMLQNHTVRLETHEKLNMNPPVRCDEGVRCSVVKAI